MLVRNKLYSRSDLEAVGYVECKDSLLLSTLEAAPASLYAATFNGKHYIFEEMSIEMLLFVTEFESLSELVTRVIDYTQIPSTYFEWNSILLINVSTSEDSLQEYAVYKKDLHTEKYYMFESYTISWMKKAQLAAHILEADYCSFTQQNIFLNQQSFNLPGIFSFEQFEAFKIAYKEFSEIY